MTQITGYNAIEEYCRRPENRGTLLISKKNARIEQILKLAGKNKGITIKRISEKDMNRMLPYSEHKGCILEIMSSEGSAAKVKSLSEFLKISKKKDLLILILDGVTDPHNIGAVLRSGDLFNVDAVIVPDKRSGGLTATVARISSGGSAWVPLITSSNLSRDLQLLKESGFWLYGADMAGEECQKISFDRKTVLIMGSEGKGLHRLVTDQCDFLIRIPTGGHIDSLNVSVAAGILLYEVRRQQNFPY